MFKKGLIIIIVFIFVLLVVDISMYLHENYTNYNSYMEKFENYGYENSDFYVPNKIVRKDTIAYMEYEYNNVVTETKQLIETYGNKYDLSLSEYKLPIDRVNYISTYLTKTIKEKFEGLKITSDSNDSEKETKEQLQVKLDELTKQNVSEFTIVEKDKFIDELKKLEEEVNSFNTKVADRIKEEEKQEAEREAERQTALDSASSYGTNSSYASNYSSSSSSSSSNNSSSNSNAGPWWKTIHGGDLRLCRPDRFAMLENTSKLGDNAAGEKYITNFDEIDWVIYITLACGPSIDPNFDNSVVYWGSFLNVKYKDGSEEFIQLPPY